MTTIKFEIISDDYGLFNVDFISCVDERWNRYIIQAQYSSIIVKINQRIKQFKSTVNVPCVVGLAILILVVLLVFMRCMEAKQTDEWYEYLIPGLILICLVGCITTCFACCNEFSKEKKEKRFKKLQNDIQNIVNEEFKTINQVVYPKWTIEKIGNRVTGKKFKLIAEFCPTASSVHTPDNCANIRMDTPALALNLERLMLSLDSEQHSQYDIEPSSPPPPSYSNAVSLFSQALFSDCSNCGYRKCVLNSQYCTRCGHTLLIENV